MKVTVVNRKGKEYGSFDLPATSKLDDLKEAFRKCKKLDKNRMRFTIGDGKAKKAFTRNLTLADFAKDGDKIMFKDLGPQVSWRGVFIIEYFGGFIAPILTIFFADYIYGTDRPEFTTVQWFGLIGSFAHFAKREFETIFIHRFSSDTMPISNLFRNSIYYWLFAFLMSYFIGHPLFTPPASEMQIYIGMGVFVVSELSNFYCHIILRNLRPAGTRERRIPRGFFFELVSCPNYFFEIMSWLGFNIATQTFAGYLFMIIGGGQMVIWATGKHRNYKKEFRDYPKNRKRIFPFIY
eukprot:CAMPEP_0113903604 /NCGR_PEP_ID=MMETSP0780_2-20120614/22651_1 /TAXON_ID=652834 /ORGANISM="Palpitomonas bilix" /LENGTH=293 /DNA_ID=CAMNT_0000896845 /DNA_START=38 /DNA_END=919 /DNA_ORIENTATION=- /assembly_acc=CAM_ASM_000599